MNKREPLHHRAIRKNIDNGLLIVILGISGSGKNTLADGLSSLYGVRRTKTFTTKPASLSDAYRYVFLSPGEFNEKRKWGELTLIREVTIPEKTGSMYVSKTHSYGASDSILTEGGIIVLDWEGYSDLISKRQGNLVAFLLDADINASLARKTEQVGGSLDAKDVFMKRLVQEGAVFNKPLIDELALDFRIFKIDAESGEDNILHTVDTILKGL